MKAKLTEIALQQSTQNSIINLSNNVTPVAKHLQEQSKRTDQQEYSTAIVHVLNRATGKKRQYILQVFGYV